MRNYKAEAKRNLANYAEFLKEQGCSKEETFQTLLAEFQGTPYGWGEETTESSDCSGTVCASLNALYKKNIRVTADCLYRSYFTKECSDNNGILAAFFLNKEGKAVHIAGYMGQGLFMNQSSIEKNGGTPRTQKELQKLYKNFMFTKRKLKEGSWG